MFLITICTECAITGNNIDRHKMREQLSSLGDSIIVAGGSRKVKIHIHTDYPAKLFNYCDQFGVISNQKADDMFQQQEDAHSKHADIAIITDSGSDIPEEFIGFAPLQHLPSYWSYSKHSRPAMFTSDELYSMDNLFMEFGSPAKRNYLNTN